MLALSAQAALAAVPSHTPSAGLIRPSSCVIDAEATAPGGCALVAGLRDTAFLTITPDGRNLYATARVSGSVVAFQRDMRTGALTLVPGPRACLTAQAATPPCTEVPGLNGASAIVSSSDGRYLYIASRNPGTVVTLSRQPKDGSIAFVNCLQDALAVPIPGCTPIEQIGDAQGIALSPDGRNVYVSGLAYGSVAVLNRDIATGMLSPTSCVVRTLAAQRRSCTPVDALAGASMVAISPDGRNVYVPAKDDDSLVMLTRDPASGALTPLGCLAGNAAVLPTCTSLPGLDFPQNAVVSADGLSVYVASTDTHTVFALHRDPATGLLSRPEGTDGCRSDVTNGPPECGGAVGLTLPFGLALSPDDRNLYVGAFGEDSVVPFARGPTGALAPFGLCASAEATDCRPLTNLDRAGFAMTSPDGRFLYVNSPTSSSITVFARGVAPGRVTFLDTRISFRRRLGAVRLRCPLGQHQGCVGTVRLRITDSLGVPRDLAARQAFALPPGGAVRLKVEAKRLLRSVRFARIIATLQEPLGGTRTVDRVVRITRRRP